MAGLSTLLLVGLVIKGPHQSMFVAGIEILPLVVLAMLAHMGWRKLWARVLAWIWVGLLLLVLLLAVMGVTLSAFIPPGADASGDWLLQPLPGLGSAMGLAALVVAAGLILATAALVPPIRRALARRLPLNPSSPVHTLALFTVLALAVMLLAPLIAVGRAPILVMIGKGDVAGAGQFKLHQAVYPLLWLVPGVFLAAGYGLHRNLRQTAWRLGLVRPTWRTLVGTGALGLLTAVATFFVSPALEMGWHNMELPTTDAAALETLFSHLLNPAGVVLVSLSAAVGEELAFRGLLQPRLGLVLPNALFVSLHSWQYNFDGLLLVFAVGLVCAWIRRRTSTVGSIVAHGTYDLALMTCATIRSGFSS